MLLSKGPHMSNNVKLNSMHLVKWVNLSLFYPELVRNTHIVKVMVTVGLLLISKDQF